MLKEALVQMPLDSAFLCADMDCRTVSNNSSACPRCHSAVLNLANVLEGREVEVADSDKTE